MMRNLFWLPLAVTAGASAVEVSGEVEVTGRAFGLADTTFTQETTRTRAFLAQDLGSSARLELGLDAYTYSGQTALRVVDLLPSSYGATLDTLAAVLWTGSFLLPQGTEQPASGITSILGRSPDFDTLLLNRALISWHGHGVSIDAGRQPVAWGTGYAWNPTNVFSRKTLLEPTRELQGIDVVRLRTGHRVRCEVLLQPDDKPEDTGWATRILTSLGGWDVSALASRVEWRRMDWSGWLAGEDVAPSLEWEARAPYWTIFTDQVTRLTLGGDLRGEWRGVGLWAETAWNHLDRGDSFLDLTAGIDHLFDFQTYLLLEYHREGEGKSSSSAYVLNDWLKVLSGERGGMGRDYLLTVLNHPLGDLSEFSLLSLWNLSDGSSLTEASSSRSLADDLTVVVAVDLPFGEDGDELGRIGRGGFLRLTAYF